VGRRWHNCVRGSVFDGGFFVCTIIKRHRKHFLVIFVLFMNYILLPKNEG